MASDLQQRILLAATALFARQGYTATAMREVAEAVGCTKPALYYHFRSKEELFLAAVQREMAHYNDLLQDILKHTGPLRDRLKAGLDAHLDHVRTEPASMKLIMTAQHAPDTDGAPVIDMLTMHAGNKRLIHALLEDGVRTGAIRAGLDLEKLSTSLIGLVNIWGMHCLLGQPVPDDISDHILDIFFHGVAPS